MEVVSVRKVKHEEDVLLREIYGRLHVWCGTNNLYEGPRGGSAKQIPVFP